MGAGSGPGNGPAEMRWWGWGREDHRVPLSAQLARLLDGALGLDGVMRDPVAPSEVALPTATLSPRARQRLEATVGGAWVQTDKTSRILHSGGKGYLDLVAMRNGGPRSAPDAVVYPDSHDAVLAVLSVCANERVAVVPFGGGTSVVGGLAPIAGSQHAVISLDLRRLAGVFSVDRRSLSVSVAAGTRAPALEAVLAEVELTLGHYPDSFEFVSIGGCAATRSVGQASSGYGRIDQAIHGVRFATPAGEMSPAALPASAAGPALRELIVGSEGVLGVITGLLLRVRARPAHRIYEGVLFGGFEAAAEALRIAVQDEATPDVVRLSDELQTRLWLAAGEDGGRRVPRGRHGRRARTAALAIVGWEGQRLSVQRRRLHTMTLLRRGGGTPIGEAAGRAWAASRFTSPYLRDELMARGVLVDQFETATTWTGLEPLRAAVTAALTGALSSLGTPPLIGCQIAHVYETGASLTFTVLARALEHQEGLQWRAAKDAASAAIIRAGATISHHHGVGRDNAGWAAAELGPLGVGSLRALKAQLDPLGLMNPGKLILAG
jgi:alkyldihydroxyacetonephosphate synthase